MNNRVLIIAEAGVNLNGDMQIARDLVDVAAEAKVDYIKFQTFKADTLATKTAKRANYQIKNTGSSDTQYNLLKKLELSKEMHYEILSYCNQKKVNFFSTGFDIESINFLIELGIDIIKIPSGEITNVPILKHIGGLNLPIILSTGMSNMDEIDFALKTLINAGSKKNDISILHCTTQYPAPYKDINLKAMLAIKKRFEVKVGYSDHSLGIEVPIAAVAMGAKIIEKHFTISRKLSGPDHLASLEPHELIKMVASIRNVEISLGSDQKIPTQGELINMKIARKSIVALTTIKKGEVFNSKNITVKRPGIGLSPILWDHVIGKVSNFDFAIDDLIKL